jgi:hypothetical protein
MTTGEIYWAVVEPYAEAVSIYDGATRFLQEFAAIPLAARTLLAAHWCVSEVCNGGFHQFFSNSTGVSAPEAEEAFRSIGLPNIAAVVHDATGFFEAPFPRDREIRQRMLEGYENSRPSNPDPFVALDKRFYELVSQEGGGWESAADRYAKRSAS